MNFSVGDRIHVTRFCEEKVDFYGTLSYMGLKYFEINNCSDIEFENKLIAMPDSEFFGLDNEDYYTLVAEQEDSEEPVIQRVEDIKRYIPDTKNLIESAFEEIEQSIYNFNQSKVNNQKVELDNHYIIEVKKGLYVEEVGSDNHFKFTKDITKAKIYEVNESTVRQYAELLDGRILNLKRYIEV